jgi:hypothetical protein
VAPRATQHVQGGTLDAIFMQRFAKGFQIDNAATGGVDQNSVRPHSR